MHHCTGVVSTSAWHVVVRGSILGPGVKTRLSTLETVSLVGRGSSVVGALALNIRDFVSLVGRGSSVVGAPFRSLVKFIYPTFVTSKN